MASTPMKKVSKIRAEHRSSPLESRSRAKSPWTTLETREIYANPWIQVRESQVLTPGGSPGIYGVVSFKNVAVGVVALDDQDRLLMVGQYRYAMNAYSWEIPEGGCPLGTRPLEAAKRELREETGYRARTWRKLLTMHLSNSVSDERAEIYEARGLSPGAAEPDDTERLEVVWVPFAEALNHVRRGLITDAISVAAILAIASAHQVRAKQPKRRGAAKKPRHSRHGGKRKKS